MEGAEIEIDELKSADCHIHPNYSIDASGSVEEYTRRAVEIGLRRICFTTHIDLDPHRAASDYYWRIEDRWTRPSERAVKTYIDEVLRVKKRYQDEIDVVAGFEFSYEPHFEDIIRQFIRHFRPDFTIGSVHAVDTLEITSRYFTPAVARTSKPDVFIPRYYSKIISLARSGLFTVIGHIDGYKKYLPRWWGLDVCEEIEEEMLDDVARALADAGASIEVNTSALRKNLPHPYPSPVVLKRLLEAGVSVKSFGSDAHKPEMIGYRFDDAAKYLSFFIEKEPVRQT